ncbi:hypothetical protein F5I97DRAFT_299205 [Phlebopus sp. FC_14]|nr:hypothetical protein F5I97DRAFT_299205 [Phlebopus sp. FC_14]
MIHEIWFPCRQLLIMTAYAQIGLIAQTNREHIQKAFKRNRALGTQEPLLSRNRKLADEFKATFARENVRVHFLGAWDTVSSEGLNKRILSSTTNMTHVCFLRHALALGECRSTTVPSTSTQVELTTLTMATSNKYGSLAAIHKLL